MDATAASLSERRERLAHRVNAIVAGLVPFLDALDVAVVCTDREGQILYRNPVFAASWNVPNCDMPVTQRVDDGVAIVELPDHTGVTSEVTLSLTRIPDSNGRTVGHIGRVHLDNDDVVSELRQAAAVIAARVASLDDRVVCTGWSEQDEKRIQTLSSREREIFDLILDGNRVATVASTLYLSEHTVRNYLKRIYQKLELGSLGELRERMSRGASRTAG